MKKKLFFLLQSIALCMCLNAQISTNQNPKSFSLDNLNLNTVNTVQLTPPDMRELDSVDAERDAMFKMQACGVRIPVDKDFFDYATVIPLQDADLYLLRVTSQYALALNLYCDDFFMPEGTQLHVYNPMHTRCLGAFTNRNNSSDGYFATDYVYNDTMVIEYYCPKNVTDRAKIHIQSIGYFYRDVQYADGTDVKAGLNTSGPCNVNINCSEGDNYRDVQRSVVKLMIPINAYQIGYCTGTILNNTQEDKKPYVITAAHCIQDVTNQSYYSQIVVVFNYETQGCSRSKQEPKVQSLTGCNVLAYDKSFSQNGGDYLFIELKENIPEDYNPYFCGWTTTHDKAPSAVCIHHPSGDVKKISVSTQQVKETQISSPDEGWDPNTHWTVTWSATDNGYGITEGGSSGSGLFNPQGMLIGVLSGGASSCYTQDKYKVDWFGKFYVAYDSIKQWLDPANTGAEELNGNSFTASLTETLSKDNNDFTLYPVPADDYIIVNASENINNAVVTVFDINGRKHLTMQCNITPYGFKINLPSLPAGTYYINVKSQHFNKTKSFTVR
ncbi:MAG: T9SS type A sorting domain-containing protein [Bacteroidales bacterium]|nr:T9SS type A sorting domain-containing protein [Bacteroidales bacterium]